jgi:hypothetical protein
MLGEVFLLVPEKKLREVFFFLFVFLIDLDVLLL